MVKSNFMKRLIILFNALVHRYNIKHSDEFYIDHRIDDK